MNAAFVIRAESILNQIEFYPYTFHVCESHSGVVLYATYLDADTYTDKIEKQTTRKWNLSPSMTKSEIVQTAFKCVLTSYEHRCREAFKYQGARVFSPHFDIDDLVRLCKDGREAAGGRS